MGGVGERQRKSTDPGRNPQPGSFNDNGWTHNGQLEEQRQRRASVSETSDRERLSRTNSGMSLKKIMTAPGRSLRRESSVNEPFPSVFEEAPEPKSETEPAAPAPLTGLDGTEKAGSDSITTDVTPSQPHSTKKHKEIFPAEISQPNGYVPPPKLPWTTSFMIGLRAFGGWVLTPFGILLTIYALNVVAWGGMLFLLLCNAAPAMCHPTCSDLHSPRKIWLEIDSQILNALFCVTGFGLIPWRFRDLYWLLVFRIGLRGRTPEQKLVGLRTLAGIHRSWFRLEGSEDWQAETHTPGDDANPAVALPLSKQLGPPLTGIRAPPTAAWKLDFVIWCNVWNTFLQVCLCGFMWGFNRFSRPSWATGLFIGLACSVAGAGGIMMFVEGKKVKRYEGVQPNPEQQKLMAQQQATP